MAKVLLIDDDPGVLLALGELVETSGHEVVKAESGPAALAALDGADVVIADSSMPGMDGLQLLEGVRAHDPTVPVILTAAQGSERVRAMKHGAYDSLSTPFDSDEVGHSIDRALETRRHRLEARERTLEHAVGVRIVGKSSALRGTIDAAVRVAPRDVTVLVRGETGTGKEIVASLLHAHSPRAERPLVKFNCAAIPHDLAEAQLFGHTRGAFTGATSARDGYFVQADGGTLFLDEVGELSLKVQAVLLRVLQDSEVQPLGSSQVDKVDVRVVAATHRDLAAEVKAGRFREDLYYRIAVVELVVPPLRDRPGDIALLAREFARKYSERFALGYVVQLSPEFVATLERQSWPGNVRQLENTIARSVALTTDRVIGPDVLASVGENAEPPVNGTATTRARALPVTRGPSFREQVEAFERHLLSNALAAAAGNQSQAARQLGITRASLYDKMKKYGLSRRAAG
jgi:DNA-binding NtrC family response regulator